MNSPTIGELRRRLRIEQETIASDGGGGGDSIWSLVAEVSGAIREATGRELSSGEQLQGRRSAEVWIRYRSDVGPSKRMVSGERIFDIKSATDPDGLKRWLRCLVEERLD